MRMMALGIAILVAAVLLFGSLVPSERRSKEEALRRGCESRLRAEVTREGCANPAFQEALKEVRAGDPPKEVLKGGLERRLERRFRER